MENNEFVGMTIGSLGKKIKKRLVHFFYRPIDVFVFHGVSDTFDNKRYQEIDWMSTADFYDNIQAMKRIYKVIPLTEAYGKLNKKKFRFRRYAVLTCDDGFEDVLTLLPFLEKEGVPITLFINAKYLDGQSKREGYSENPKYITREELFCIQNINVTIGLHGYEHVDVTKQTVDEFESSLQECLITINHHKRYIPYFAYTWGRYNEATHEVLKRRSLIPVLTDGSSNFLYVNGISRVLLVSNTFK